jgi:hypothetical protein
MKNRSGKEHHAAVEEALLGLPDVTVLTGVAGQVLVYPGHFPHGLYAVLSGSVELTDARGVCEPERVSAERAPFVIPAPDEIDVAAGRGVTVAEPARLLFIPRGLASRSQAVAAILRGCQVSARSLRLPRTA